MSGEIFDVKSALKEHPESEVAAHLAELHGINRADYIKEGLSDAEFLSEYGGKTLPVAQTTTSVTQLSPEALASRNDPLNTAVAGTIAGVAAGTGSKTLDFAKAIKNMGAEKAPIDLEPVVPTEPPKEYFAPGQKYSAKTGYGSGPGTSVAETVEHKAEETAPLGRGKVSSKIKGPASPDEILAAAKQKEADALLHARIIAQDKLAHDQAQKDYAAKQQEYVKKQQDWALRQKALAQEKKFGLPNKIGTTKAVTGASVGYNAMDAINQAQEGDPAQAALAATGVAAAAAPYVKKLPPKLRAIGTGISLGAPIVNRGIDVVEDFAAGGLAKLAGGGGPPAPGKLGKIAGLAQKAAHELHGQTPGRMTDFLQHNIGKFVVPTQSDRMGGVGGPSFSANSLVLPQYKGKAWGSGNEGTATSITNLAKDERFGGPENQIFVPLLGHQNQHKSNQIAFDRLMKDFYEHPEKLTPELRAKINDFMQSGGGIEKATGQPFFSPFADFDIADRDTVGLLGRSFDNRGLIAQHGFGGERLGKTKSQIFPYQQRLDEMADPTVAGAPTFAVGPRAFQLTGDVHPEARPDLNAAFPYLLEGRDLNVAYRPVENSAIFQDFQNQWRQHKGKTEPLKSGKLPEPGYYENTIGYKVNPDDAERIYPRQEVTEQLLDSMYKKGHADGGSIDGYADGKSIMPDVSVNARSMPNMTGMPGVGYMQTPQGAMARLQMEKELEEARIRAGVSGMAMSIPGQQGIKTMPGQMDIGANIPVGRGNLDISANRSINPIPGRGHMQGVNARYTLPFAQGGEVQHFANGKIVLAKRMILPPAENAARTQIIGTLPTYAKAADVLAQRGAGGTGIDVGAGLGKGAEVLASKLGKDVRTMEPYAQKWSPDYSSAEQMPSDAHGFLTNLNVLNVMPREARDELVQHIGRTMEPGGLGVLTTRGADVMKAQGRPGPEPMSMITSRDTYQKGFNNQELEDYLKYMLGQGYDINKLNLGPAGALIKKK